MVEAYKVEDYAFKDRVTKGGRGCQHDYGCPNIVHYLRYLLIHGARTVVNWSQSKTDPLSRWIQRLDAKRGRQKAIVALANKCARIAWVVLNRKVTYQAAAKA